jgi:para-nitrobenzyl esterase
MSADNPLWTRRTALAAGLLCGGLSAPSWANGISDPRVETTFGSVQGIMEERVCVFKGIRYGADTATTRFGKPNSPAPWRETLPARDYGPASPQPGSEANQSEDCLFLNVWTPDLNPAARRPVMVYIHGGAYTTGSGSSLLTDGMRLAGEEDVVVVTINHRLNAFGYLYFDQLAPGFRPDGGNAGQWDLILALRWVANNITRFGGDPSRVMLFGQSGGGAKIATLMATPVARGLFHAVATMSGQQVTASGPLNATRRTRAFLDTLKISTAQLDSILTVPAPAIIEALSTLDPLNNEQKIYFGPVLDSLLLPRHPFWPDAPPLSRNIPMILGNVKDETRNLIGQSSPEAFSLGFDDLPMWLGKHMRTDIAPGRVISTFRQAYPGISAPDLFFAATTAGRSWRGQVEEADARARQSGPTWVYRMDQPSPRDGGKWGAFHTIDIPHAFRNLTAQGSPTGNTAIDQTVSRHLSKALVSLARRGNPNHANLPYWPPYRLDKRETLILGAQTNVQSDPRGVERALFATVPFVQWGT